jgi:hypothetical protein
MMADAPKFIKDKDADSDSRKFPCLILVAFEEDEEKEQAPLLFIDVNLGEGNKPRITLYNGDKPEHVASKFAKFHSNFH